jgi:anti-sigma factor RsiW
MDCAQVREDRMDVLYGEAGAEALRRVETHHAACAACAEEFLALRSVRQRLASWRLPERSRARVMQRHQRPLIALAAAASLVLALAGAVRLAGASFEYNVGGATFRIGAPEVTKLLQQQQARHQEEIRALRASLVETPPVAAPREDQLLSRVQQLIRENEQRQAARFNTSLEELAARAEAQRRYDLARVSAGLSYLDGKSGQHVARTSELMGYVLQASEPKK